MCVISNSPGQVACAEKMDLEGVLHLFGVFEGCEVDPLGVQALGMGTCAFLPKRNLPISLCRFFSVEGVGETHW